jgi:hypothetical protein
MAGGKWTAPATSTGLLHWTSRSSATSVGRTAALRHKEQSADLLPLARAVRGGSRQEGVAPSRREQQRAGLPADEYTVEAKQGATCRCFTRIAAAIAMRPFVRVFASGGLAPGCPTPLDEACGCTLK